MRPTPSQGSPGPGTSPRPNASILCLRPDCETPLERTSLPQIRQVVRDRTRQHENAAQLRGSQSIRQRRLLQPEVPLAESRSCPCLGDRRVHCGGVPTGGPATAMPASVPTHSDLHPAQVGLSKSSCLYCKADETRGFALTTVAEKGETRAVSIKRMLRVREPSVSPVRFRDNAGARMSGAPHGDSGRCHTRPGLRTQVR